MEAAESRPDVVDLRCKALVDFFDGRGPRPPLDARTATALGVDPEIASLVVALDDASDLWLTWNSCWGHMGERAESAYVEMPVRVPEGLHALGGLLAGVLAQVPCRIGLEAGERHSWPSGVWMRVTLWVRHVRGECATAELLDAVAQAIVDASTRAWKRGGADVAPARGEGHCGDTQRGCWRPGRLECVCRCVRCGP